MPYNTKALLVDLNGNFIPQGFNPSADEYRPTTGVDLGDNRHALDMLAWGKTSGGVYVPIRVSTDGVQEVTLNGSIETLRPMTGGTKTASSVASEVFAGLARLEGRRGLAIKNEHPYLRLRIDGAAVTDMSGIALEPFAQAIFALDPEVDVPVYVISEAGIVRYGVVEW